MTANLHRARELFLHAVGKLEPDQWEIYIAEASGGDDELKRQVWHLLQVHREAGSFLEQPAVASAEPVLTINQPITEKPGAQIGPYKLLQQIGEGGMGVVYMAEQKKPINRRVALKIIKPGMDTRQVIARFEAERQALAMMDHPNIAKVLDAGATESGRPYFVMELVNGLPVTKYCDEQHLTPKERLELFVPICQAVQHAHQKGIIHRDLKPSNILIALYDGQPISKIIDFGVAKATSQTLTEKTMFTQLGQVVGTLEYMSPEQAERNQLDIDTRSDIYSLGVVLYELLTGETPFDRHRLRSAAFGEMLRIIREEEPSKPSTKVSGSDSLPSIAANRRTVPAKLCSAIRGELDWIVMKALEKDRGRRYETASKFADDIGCFLRREPVTACPPSSAYLWRKFFARHRRLIATTAVIIGALSLGLVTTAWQAIRATTAETKATAQRDRALLAEEAAKSQEKMAEANLKTAITAVEEMLTRVAEEELADQPQMEKVRRDLLQRALDFYQGFLSDHPGRNSISIEAARANFRVGRIHALLGQTERATHALADVIEAAERLPGTPESRLLRAESELCLGAMVRGTDLGRSEQLLASSTKSLQLLKEDALLSPSDRLLLAHSCNDYGVSLHFGGKFAAAARAFQRALAECEALLTLDVPESDIRHLMGGILNNYAHLEQQRGNLDDARNRIENAIVCHRKATALEPSRRTFRKYEITHYYVLASILFDMNEFAQAIGVLQHNLERANALAADFPLVPSYRKTLALQYHLLGKALLEANRPDEALAGFEREIEIRQVLANEFQDDAGIRSDLAAAYGNLGNTLAAQGQLDESVGCYRQAINLDPKLALAHFALAKALQAQGEFDGAITCYRKAIDLAPDFVPSHVNLGVALAQVGNLNEAIECWQKASELDPANATARYNLDKSLETLRELNKTTGDQDAGRQLLEGGRSHESGGRGRDAPPATNPR